MYIDFLGLHCDESFILTVVGINISSALWNLHHLLPMIIIVGLHMFIKLSKCFLNAVNEPSQITKEIIIFDGELVCCGHAYMIWSWK